jgi:hypothetical protein
LKKNSDAASRGYGQGRACEVEPHLTAAAHLEEVIPHKMFAMLQLFASSHSYKDDLATVTLLAKRELVTGNENHLYWPTGASWLSMMLKQSSEQELRPNIAV